MSGMGRLALLLPFAFLTASGSGAARRGAEDAAAAVLARFDHVPLVALCEHHRRREVHDFLLALLELPDFGRKVDDVVVEFGNALHQELADRYVAGEDVPEAELRKVWRDTGQWLVWDSPLYERFFVRVRELNASRPDEERIRVLLGDPPIPWAETKDAAGYRRFAERDRHFAEVVEKEVLARGHRALLVMGSTHFQRRGPLDVRLPGGMGVGGILEERHPGELHVVWTLPGSAELARSLGFERAPALTVLEESPLGEESFARIAPQGISIQVTVNGRREWKPLGEVSWPPMLEVVDSLLWLGPEETTVDPDPAIYREPAYQAELRRRAKILGDVYGMEFLPELEELLRSSH